MACPGDKIDIPMNHIYDVYVRSHYDGMTVSVPGGPQSDEIAIIFCASSGKRLNARVGGLTHEEVMERKVSS
ncbi:amino acid synthesis family protein [Aquamicrobium terrae]|uniref:amino acid synthesis family protein n=1 Tax=Aquamicrobium terrae TaxID=1324945 RepID=UPI0033978BEC